MTETVKQESEGIEVRTLTYNIFLRPPLVTNNGNDYKDERLQYFIDHHLNNFDIIALQEMFSTGNYRKSKLLNSAQKLGLKYSASLDRNWRQMKPIDSGLLIISRFPIIEKDYVIFKEGGHVDNYTTKGVLSTLLEITPSLKCFVMTTHLQANYGGSESDIKKYAKIQKSQLDQVRSFIIKKQQQYPHVPIILLGDFNIFSDTGKEKHKHYLTYKYMIETVFHPKMKWINVCHDQLGEPSPITFGAVTKTDSGELIPFEKVLTNQADQCSQVGIDYMFFIEAPHLEFTNEKDYKEKNNFKLSLAKNSVQLEKFLVEKQPFTQLSDHFGISAKFIVEKL